MHPPPSPPLGDKKLVGTLAYHCSCIRLLASCCMGNDTELVVKASGYLNMQQVGGGAGGSLQPWAAVAGGGQGGRGQPEAV